MHLCICSLSTVQTKLQILIEFINSNDFECSFHFSMSYFSSPKPTFQQHNIVMHWRDVMYRV
jgi:hypothetical protein